MAQSLAVDGSGVYIGGYTSGALPGESNFGRRDGFLRRYNAAGNLISTAQLATSDPVDRVKGIAGKALSALRERLTR